MNDWVDAEHHVERAHELYDAGRWDEAVKELRRALSLNPYQAEWHFNLGLTLEAGGRHEDAAECFAQAHALHENEGQSEAHAALLAGMNLIRANKPEQGLGWLDRVEKINPRLPDLAPPRIDALTMLAKHDQAEEVFYLAQEHDPDNPDLYAAMAESLMQRQLHDKAVWCLREAARLDPGIPRIQARLADAYASTGRLERARQLYLRELRNDPGDIDTLLDLGDLLVEMHRPAEAGEKFRRVLELSPENADAHFSLGDLAEAHNDLPGALVQFDVVIRLDPTYPGARRRLAGLLIGRGREEDQIRSRDLLRADLRDQRIDADRFTTEDLDELGGCLLDASMAIESAGVYRRLLKRRPGDHLAHHHLALALFEAGHTDAGLNQARQALVFEPRFVPAMHNMAVAHLRRGQWMRARYWVRRATRIDPDDPALRRLRMRLHLRAVGGLALWGFKGLRRAGRLAWGASIGRPTR